MSRPQPSAGSPARVRFPRAVREFIALPLMIVAIILLLAIASIYGDQANGAVLHSLRSAAGHLIGKKASSTTLQAVATGLVTVTSITFSVLLLAVQQTASNLSPVVFDQFVRRRANQVFLGLFVGLALYAYVVMAAVQDKTPPIIGAFVATVLTVLALGCLLFLVYSTIDQMRPRNVMRRLHDHAARAHDRERQLVAQTRRESLSRLPVLAVHHSDNFGYVESIDLDRISKALRREADGQALADVDSARQPEVEVLTPIGTDVVMGDVIASVRHHDEAAAARIARAVARAITLSPAPDLDVDASTGIADLANIAWTSGSTAKQNPAIAAQALHALRDLAVRWVVGTPDPARDRHAVVYPERDVAAVLDALHSCLVAANESHQHQQAARVLDSYLTVLSRAHGTVAERIRDDLARVQPLVEQLPDSAALAAARRRVDEVLGDHPDRPERATSNGQSPRTVRVSDRQSAERQGRPEGRRRPPAP